VPLFLVFSARCGARASVASLPAALRATGRFASAKQPRACTHKQALSMNDKAMSALPSKSNIGTGRRHVCHGPKADILIPVTSPAPGPLKTGNNVGRVLVLGISSGGATTTRGRSRSAIRGWSPIPASNATTPSLCLSEKQRVDADEGVRLAKTYSRCWRGKPRM
jgi:hypothetical protein